MVVVALLIISSGGDWFLHASNLLIFCPYLGCGYSVLSTGGVEEYLLLVVYRPQLQHFH